MKLRAGWSVGWVVGLVAVQLGCAGGGQVVVEPLPTPTAGPPMLAWVVSDGALVVLDEAGVEQRRVALGVERADGVIQGRAPGQAWVLAGRSLYEVDVVGGAVKAPLELPPMVCAGEELSDMSLQSAAGLGLDGDQVCVVLQDRNDNMMDFQAFYRVEPTTGAVSGVLTISLQESCAASVEPSPCQVESSRVVAGGPDGEGLRLDQAACAVVLADGRTLAMERDPNVEGACDLQFEGRSASGRFQGLAWDLDDSGDYIYRRFVIVDTQQGRPVQETAVLITGETLYQWAPRTDALILDGNLLILGDAPKAVAAGGAAVFVR